MSYLFLDSSSSLDIGLLDEGFNWLNYKSIKEKKISSIIHKKIDKLTDGNHLDLKGVFICSGPGSYTGMRVVEGIAQIYKWLGLPVYSFYHFELPAIRGVRSGSWVSEAFKGEVFEYIWEGQDINKKLVPYDNFKPNQDSLFSKEHSFLSYKCQSTKELLKEESSFVFEKIKEMNKHLPIYYYRIIEEEFRPQA